MKILITGNLGYIGPIVSRALKNYFEDLKVIGIDSGFYSNKTTIDYNPEVFIDLQYFCDIRNIPDDLLFGVDSIIHLAAISNDPIGNKFEKATNDINYEATIKLAEKAIKNGVKRFIFASSCSVYGQAEGGPRKENDSLNPLTAYSKSKISTEEALKNLSNKDMLITSLRFATACGMSPRLRLDLVLNDFVACARTSKKIVVLSDGSPWRPLIDVNDMARAIIWALNRNSSQGNHFLAINTGSNAWNYQIKDLANKVANVIPGTEVIINKNAPPDKRSYKVDFSLFEKLGKEYQPISSIEETINKLNTGLSNIQFSESNFRESLFMRLKVLEKHISSGYLTNDLFWNLNDKN